MIYLTEYGNYTFDTAPFLASGVIRVNIPQSRPLQALCIEIDATVTGALTGNSPEAIFSSIVLRAGKDVVVDMDGAEAWKMGSILSPDMAFKQNNVATVPSCLIVIPFGPKYALPVMAYNQVTLELTVAAVETRVAATTFATGSTCRVFGVEQDMVPELAQGGMPITRRFLRTETATPAAGDVDIDLPRAEAYMGLMLLALDARTTSVYTLDQADDNLTRYKLSCDMPGLRARLIDVHWKSLCKHGLTRAGIMSTELAGAIGATGFLRDWIGVAYAQLREGGQPFDASAASKLWATVTVAGAVADAKLIHVRDVLVHG